MTSINPDIKKSKLLYLIAHIANRIVLPGFKGNSLYVVGKTLIQNIREHRLNIRGAAVTYNFFMAIPPSLLFFASLLPYFPLKGAEESILTIIKVISPNEKSYNSLRNIVSDFLNNERREVLSFGILSTFFFSSNGMMGLMRTFDRSHDLYVKRTGLKRRWIALKLTAVMLFVIILTIAALIIQTNYINSFIEQYIQYVMLVKVVTLIIIILMIFLAVCMIYTYGPSLRYRFPFFSVGAVFSIFAIVLTTSVFFSLAKNVIQYNKIYGSIGTLMAFMIWLFLNTQVILLGYELNLSVMINSLRNRKSHNVPDKKV